MATKASWRLALMATGISLAAALAPPAWSGSAAAEPAILQVLHAQARAWNCADLDKFMSYYLNSPETSYTSGAKQVWGYAQLQKRYQDRYGKSKATMGKLDFSDLRVIDLGPEQALCIGQWHLRRQAAPQKLNGVFSLVLVHGKDGWKIIHDHTSAAPNSTTPAKPGRK